MVEVEVLRGEDGDGDGDVPRDGEEVIMFFMPYCPAF